MSASGRGVIDTVRVETPDAVHGRLLEAVHISGYTMERACGELEWLLEDGRWQRCGVGYESIGDFLATIDLSEFRLAVDRRKQLSRKLADLEASQRQTATALGVGQSTVERDLNGKRDPRGSPPGAEAPQEVAEPAPSAAGDPPGSTVADAAPDIDPGPEPAEAGWFGDDVAPAKLAKRRSERKRRDREAEERHISEAREQADRQPEPTPKPDLRHGDFRDVLADLTGVHAIITDPPYPVEHLPLLDDLAAWADKVLGEDGILAVLIGQTHLPEVFRRLDGHRPYRWTGCYQTAGPGYVSHPRRVQSQWKPLLVYGGGPRFSDLICSSGDDKRHHRWGQNFDAFAEIVHRLTEPGQTVVDPFAGGGTTLLAAYAAGRHAIGAEADDEAYVTAAGRLGVA